MTSDDTDAWLPGSRTWRRSERRRSRSAVAATFASTIEATRAGHLSRSSARTCAAPGHGFMRGMIAREAADRSRGRNELAPRIYVIAAAACACSCAARAVARRHRSAAPVRRSAARAPPGRVRALPRRARRFPRGRDRRGRARARRSTPRAAPSATTCRRSAASAWSPKCARPTATSRARFAR